MTINEMHQSVMQGVDKINAQVADTLLTPEIDRELNKAIQQFVTTRFQKNNKHMQGFEESQKRRDDLRTLIMEAQYATSFKETIRDESHMDGGLYVDTWQLPEDYMHLINVNAIIQRRQDCEKISYQLQDQDTMYYFTFPLKEFVANNGAFYVDEIWIVNDIELDWGDDGWNGVQIWNNSNFSGAAWPNNSQEIIDEITTNNPEQVMFPIFWEQWDAGTPPLDNNPDILSTSLGVYNFPGQFVFPINVTQGTFDEIVSDISESDDVIGLNNDSSLGPVTNLVARVNNTSVRFSAIKYNLDTSHRRVPSTTEFIRESYSCRLVQHDDIFKLVDDPFNKTKYSTPLTVMRGNRIDVYSDNVFLTDQIRLTYLKRPQQVSIAEELNCDLPEATHEEICKFAVLSILEEISDPRFNTHLMQVDKME